MAFVKQERRQKQQELQQLLKEKMQELDRYVDLRKSQLL